MKKDRNTFFTNYNAQSQSYIPNMQIPQPQMQMQPQQFGPYQSASTQSSYYAGPDIAATNDIDNRLAKIERQINRLDSRVTKLENAANMNIESNDPNYSNMYMI